MADDEERMLVTTDSDLWNAADGSGFFVTYGQVKPLPEETTPIIDDALNQGLLREATQEEKNNYEYQQAVEDAVRKRKIKPGNNYQETVQRYQAYIKSLEQKEEEKESEKKEEPQKEEMKQKPQTEDPQKESSSSTSTKSK